MEDNKNNSSKQNPNSKAVSAATPQASATSNDKSKELNPNRVLVVANNKRYFENAGQFLSRRGYDTVVVSSLAEAIKLITEARPKYGFISYNLKNANVKKMEMLLTKNFKLQCVVISEETGSQAAAKLSREGFAHIMQAPVSGPGMYGQIQKMIKEEETGYGDHDSHHKATHGNWQDRSSEKITVKKTDFKKSFDANVQGEWKEVTGSDGKKSWEFEGATDTSLHGKAGVYTFSGEKPPTLNANGEWDFPEDGQMDFHVVGQESSKPGVIFQQGLPDSKSSGGYFPDQKDKESSAADFEVKQEKWKGVQAQDHSETQKKKTGFSSDSESHKEDQEKENGFSSNSSAKDKNFSSTQETPKSKEFSAKSDGPQATKFNESQTGPKASGFNESQKGPKADGFSEKSGGPNSNAHSTNQSGPSPSAPSFDQKSNQAKANSSESGAETRKKSGFQKTDAEAKAEKAAEEQKAKEEAAKKNRVVSLAPPNFDATINDEKTKELAEATTEALNDAFEAKAKENQIRPCGKVTKTHVFSIYSEKFKGILILSRPESMDFNGDKMKLVREKLIIYLGTRGHQIKDIDDVKVEINEVDLAAWAKDFSAFCLEGVDDSDEVICAFVPTEDLLGKTKQSAQADMLAIETLSLSPDQKLEFNVYLYFPVNEKYIWYIGKDKHISVNQLGRLINSRMSFVHIKKEDQKAFFAYCVMDFLNKKLKDPKSLIKEAV